MLRNHSAKKFDVLSNHEVEIQDLIKVLRTADYWQKVQCTFEKSLLQSKDLLQWKEFEKISRTKVRKDRKMWNKTSLDIISISKDL